MNKPLTREAFAQMRATWLSQLATWDDPNRDSDWKAVIDGEHGGSGESETTGIPALQVTKQRWRKAVELMRRYERSRAISFWPTEAPTGLDAFPCVLKWLLLKAERLRVFDAIFMEENDVSVFDSYMKRQNRPIGDDNIEAIGKRLGSLKGDVDPRIAELVSQSLPKPAPAIPGIIGRKAVQDANPEPEAAAQSSDAIAPALPKRKPGRPSKADIAARALLVAQATATAHAAPAAIAEPDPAAIEAAPQATAVEVAVEEEAKPAAAETIQDGDGAPTQAEAEEPVEALSADEPVDEEVAELESQLAAATAHAEQIAERLAAAKAPVPTNAMRAELDAVWPDNGIAWPAAMPRNILAAIKDAHRSAVETSTALAVIDASIASAGGRLSAEPSSVDKIFAEIAAARARRTELVDERAVAAEAIKAASLKTPVIEAPVAKAAEAAQTLPLIQEEDPRDAEIARLTQRIAELEHALTIEVAKIRDQEPKSLASDAEQRKQSVRHTIGTISLVTKDGVEEKRSKAIKILSDWSSAILAKAKGVRADAHGHDVRTVEGPDKSSWALRHTHPDARAPQRSWTVEATVTVKNGELSIFAQVILTGKANESFTRSRPKFLKQLAELGGWMDAGVEVMGEARQIDNLATFHNLALDPMRRLPLVVVSLTNANALALVDADELARHLHGVAHVALISQAAGRAITTVHTKRWSVYDGAIRVYQTIPDIATDDPYRHRYLPARDLTNPRKGSVLEALLEHALEISSVNPNVAYAVDFATVEQSHVNSVQEELLAKPEDEQTGSELRRLAAMREKQVEDSLSEIKTLHELLSEESERRQEAMAECRTLALEVRKLRAEKLEAEAAAQSLKSHLNGKLDKQQATAAERAAVETHQQLMEHLQVGLDSRIAITPKALRDLRKNPHANVAMIMEALDLLSKYLDMKQGIIDFKSWERIRKESRLTDCSYSKDAKQLEQDYTFEYLGKTYVAERHIKWGNDPDIRIAVRVYYTYDDDLQQAIVSSLTYHLPVRSTN